MSIPAIFTIIGGTVGELFTGIRQYLVSRLLRREEKKEQNINWHFSILVNDVIEPIISLVRKLSIQNGQIVHEWRLSVNNTQYLSFPKSFGFEQNEPFESFKAHYPETGDAWTKLKEKAVKQREKTQAFQKKIKEVIEEKGRENGISTPVKEFGANEELISDRLPLFLCQTLYKKSQGENATCDFNEAKIVPRGEFHSVYLYATEWASLRTTDRAEMCKSIFASIQNLAELKRQASVIIQDAKQIKGNFDVLKSELNDIKSYGLRSEDPKYKFKVANNCPICKKMFYKSKQK